MVTTPPHLQRRAEFRRVAARGRKWAAPGLVLQAARQSDAPHPMRVGFTASRKVGGAVVRNRARRRLKALAHAVLPDHAKEGYDYVLIARAATPERPFPALRDDLMAALSKVGALRSAAPAEGRDPS